MIEVQGLGRRATLAGAEACPSRVRGAEAELALAAHRADLFDPAGLPAAETKQEVCRRRFNGDHAVRPGGDGAPEVLRSCFLELGVVLRTSAGGAKFLVADALDLRHRLPKLWVEVQAGRVPGWKARKVAQATRHLPSAATGGVDAGLAGLLSSLPWSRFEALPEATVMRADPVGVGPVTAATLRDRLRGRDARITLRPVAVPGHASPVDAYEIPSSVREAVLLRNPAGSTSSPTRERSPLGDNTTARRATCPIAPVGTVETENQAPWSF
ncbi:MAG: hypothetical protein ACRYG2_04725 [Janthinobacterium lividum]